MISCLLSCVHQTYDRINVYHVLIISYLYPALYHIRLLSYHNHQTGPKRSHIHVFRISVVVQLSLDNKKIEILSMNLNLLILVIQLLVLSWLCKTTWNSQLEGSRLRVCLFEIFHKKKNYFLNKSITLSFLSICLGFFLNIILSTKKIILESEIKSYYK